MNWETDGCNPLKKVARANAAVQKGIDLQRGCCASLSIDMTMDSSTRNISQPDWINTELDFDFKIPLIEVVIISTFNYIFCKSLSYL